MLGIKSSEKSAKNVFYIHTNIVTKKWGEKTHETIFPETHELCEQIMLGKKTSEKSAKNGFLYSHEYRDQKMGEKSAKQIFPERH